MKKRIALSQEIIEKCRKFAIDAAATQQAIEFGQTDTAERELAESARDILIGKLAEAAVCSMLKCEYGIDTEPDFNVYPRGVWDDNDVEIYGKKIDVKSTRIGRWFLIEWNKLQFRAADDDLPSGFIACRTAWDMETDQPGNWVEIEGYISVEDIQEKRYGIQTLRKGECIPGTGTHLQADNYGTLFENLPDDWDQIMETLKKDVIRAGGSPLQNAWEAETIQPEAHVFAKYSYLTNDIDFLKNSDSVSALLAAGVKLMAFCDAGTAEALKAGRREYCEAGLLKTYEPQKTVKTICITDGDCTGKLEELKELSASTPSFNYEQYIIEHAPAERSLIVEAGAGTGKTTVMVDRILFLLHTVPDLAFEDIAMITFTNEAADNMKRRIEAAVLARAKAVRSPKYVVFLESISKLRISTIHSFSKELMAEIGSSVGYSAGMKLRSFRYEKEQIVQDVLDEIYSEGKRDPVEKTIGIKLHEAEKLLLTFWQTLDRIGISDQEIEELDWGKSSDEQAEALHEVLKRAFTELNRRYQQLKLREDAVSVEDIIRELRRILESGQEIRLKTSAIKYLFIDEFQDTDNAQIAAAVWLAAACRLKIFAVGDVKQSIYRFRGAVETAFEKLSRSMMDTVGEEPDRYQLIRNYRTSADVMSSIDQVFRRMEIEGLLAYGTSLSPQRTDVRGKYHIQNIYSNMLEARVSRVLREALDECVKYAEDHNLASKISQRTAVLTRTNFQANQIGELCRKEKIPCCIRKEGTLFLSRAATDLAVLLRTYLYPNNTEALFDLLNSPFTPGVPDTAYYAGFIPGSSEQTAALREALRESGYEDHLYSFRMRPVIAVLYELISDPEIVVRYSEERYAELADWPDEERALQVQIDTDQYRADIEEIFSLLRSKFSNEIVSLSGMYEYLKLCILTNRSDDEPDITGNCGPGCIYCMTVHKAKGLEFDTVVIPYTARVFRRECATEILIDESCTPRRAGWCRVEWKDMYKTEIEEMLTSEYYEQLAENEMSDTSREEARLLYVAMTRAVRRLEVIAPVKCKPHSWAEFLEA